MSFDYETQGRVREAILSHYRYSSDRPEGDRILAAFDAAMAELDRLRAEATSQSTPGEPRLTTDGQERNDILRCIRRSGYAPVHQQHLVAALDGRWPLEGVADHPAAESAGADGLNEAQTQHVEDLIRDAKKRTTEAVNELIASAITAYHNEVYIELNGRELITCRRPDGSFNVTAADVVRAALAVPK